MGDSSVANSRWGEMLSAWAIPADLVEAAPESPYFFDPAVFVAAADDALARADDSVSDRVAREAMPDGGTVLDVGAGAGAASLRLGPGHATAVDPSAELLEAFALRAEAAGVDHNEIQGIWPDVAPMAPIVDVVVCHHLAYNVSDLRTFAAALDGHARRRVVIELTAVHPMAWMTPYWKALHGIGQPDRPTAADAIAVLEELGLAVHQERWARPVQMIGELGEHQAARIARRLCLPRGRLPELGQVLHDTPPPTVRDVVTIWW